jgi:HSP20 family protein
MTKSTEVAVVQRNHNLPVTRRQPEEDYITPFADVYETPVAYLLMIDMPGATKESINVSIENNVLVVKASVEPYHKSTATLLSSELRTTGYYREFNMGNGIDRSNIDARYELGVLTVKLYKSEELKSKEIKIR